VSTDSGRDPRKPKEIFEDWLDLDLRFRRTLIGLRYEAFQPHELSPDSVREGIVQRYAELDLGGGVLRVGNFYEMFGRGLLFRSYEDRSIRIDGNMDGVLLTGRRGPIAAKALSGRIREVETDERTDVLRGADVEGRIAPGLDVGASYLILSSRDPNPQGASPPPPPRHEEALGGRAALARGWFDAYVEAGRINRLYRTNLDAARGLTYDDLRGSGVYGAVNVAPMRGVAVTAEYKDYEEFRFQPTGSPGTNYNNPPALTRESSTTLLSRHPHILDPNDEKGFQVEGVITHGPGATLTVSRSETDRQSGRLYFHEWFGEYRRPFGARADVAVIYDEIEDAESGTKNRTPALEVEFRPGGERGLRGEYQFQDTRSDIGTTSTHFVLAEVNVDLDLTVSVVGEHATFLVPVSAGVVEVAKDDFVYAQVDYHVSSDHFVSVTVGKRRAGYICVGGICRYEPEFEGVEMKLVSTF
jgi:hypothetical protein